MIVIFRSTDGNIISKNGTIKTWRKIKALVSCFVSYKYFPFDEHLCPLTLYMGNFK